MTKQGNGQPLRYIVRTAAEAKNTLKQLHAQAVQAGTSPRFMAAVRQIGERLLNDPRTFGEPLYHLPALKLQVRQAVVVPVVVVYGVHDEKPLVFIRVFNALS